MILFEEWEMMALLEVNFPKTLGNSRFRGAVFSYGGSAVTPVKASSHYRSKAADDLWTRVSGVMRMHEGKELTGRIAKCCIRRVGAGDGGFVDCSADGEMP